MYQKNSKKTVLILFFLLSSTSLFAGESMFVQSTIHMMLSAFVAGILLTFTPCVLPMVPIVSSVIAGQGENITKTKAVILSVSYVLGTAVTYALMGALAGATGEQLQSYFQNIWAISAMSMVFVVMSLSMFGLFTIELPSFIQSKLNAESQGLKGGKLGMVFLLGMISALILGACVSPILISFLSVAISSSDPVLGAMTMFFLALGMGVPLILLGVGAGYILPKSGAWMEKVKYVFGALLLGVAIEIFSTLELVNTLLLWGIYAVGISIYLGATQALDSESSGWKKLQKALATVLLIWGTILMVGAGYGEQDIYYPLPKTSVTYLQDGKVKLSGALPFEEIANITAYDIKRRQAMDENKTMVVFFHTDTCPVCKHLRDTTFKDQRVQEKLQKDYVAVSVNMSEKTDIKIEEIKQMFQVFGPPGFVFIGPNGKEIKDAKFYGYQEPEEFYDTLDLIAE
ncbi:protein-disulfide reductase DsbD [Sulfurovum sp. AR]|uniref:protein-disulfide reductase DsbD family protein n=1 Tax=Sulfurovum sp. AR TaxID=1165841 RepID=UPI00025C4C8D|nr:protein-disulfide reductase DsbD [Sulfurovum sp. AR]EIF52001.1 Protein-disulfide reductase [Sulfurovum sp. AR]